MIDLHHIHSSDTDNRNFLGHVRTGTSGRYQAKVKSHFSVPGMLVKNDCNAVPESSFEMAGKRDIAAIL